EPAAKPAPASAPQEQQAAGWRDPSWQLIGSVTFCHANMEWHLGHGFEVTGYTSMTTSSLNDLRGFGGHQWDANDVIPSYEYWDAFKHRQTQDAKGDQSILANGCSTAPAVPPAVTCESDQDPVDNGSTPGSIAGDNIADACVDHPDATCTYTDQHPENLTGGPSKESCVDNPDASCAFDEEAYDNGGSPTSLESCRVLPDVTCPKVDETATDTNNNGSLDTCVAADIVSAASCESDETPRDTNNNGALDTCVPNPDVFCGTGVGVDTNNNGSLDGCVWITPIIDCGVGNADGSRTLRWRWRNTSGHSVAIPAGIKNLLVGGNQPTVFTPGEGSFTTTIWSAQVVQMWMVTGNSAFGFYNSALTAPCFQDVCPNLAGDQDAPPTGMAINISGSCVQQVTTCTGNAVLIDNDSDGVTDLCATLTPQVSCVEDLADGSFNAYFYATNANAVTVDVPHGTSNKFDAGLFSGQPTSFPVGNSATFVVNVPTSAASFRAKWKLTGNSAIARQTSTECYPDACPNLAGDQNGLPRDMAVNKHGDCVDEVTSCADRVILLDSDDDGVNDLCAELEPVLECVTDMPDGSFTAYFHATNANPVALNVPDGLSNKFDAGIFHGQPTYFPVGDSATFAVNVPTSAASPRAKWKLTGNNVIARATDTPCFEDACPNLAGDQDGVPSDMVVNSTGDCVPEPPTCDAGQTLSDSDSDGVNDTCVTPESTSAAPGSSDTSPGDGGSAAPSGSETGDTSSNSDTSGDAAPGDSDAETSDDEEESAAGSGTETVVAAASDDSNGGGLPYTGGPLGLLALIGLGSLGAGALVRRTPRRRRSSSVSE
ncbi:MAG: hypothetical protein KDC46_05140, partial [Thermoleophilia bacterium]|nr:hypothetical protein [Thermoleophilia bacterium]